MTEKIIMGIDPGLANTGWGVVSCAGSTIKPVAYGCISTTKRYDLPTRLAIIHDNLLELIDRYMPVALSVEGIYFGENTKSAMYTAQARGAALVACSYKGLEYGEYTPMQIKQALVGTGTADKKQVQYMVRAVLGLDHEPKPDHAADALAAAITHARMQSTLTRSNVERDDIRKAARTKSTSGWDAAVARALAKEKTERNSR